MIKVKELIELLQQCDPDFVVKHDDYSYINYVTQMEDVGGKGENRVSLK